MQELKEPIKQNISRELVIEDVRKGGKKGERDRVLLIARHDFIKFKRLRSMFVYVSYTIKIQNTYNE